MGDKGFGGSNEADVTIYRKPEEDIIVNGAALPRVDRFDTAESAGAGSDKEQGKQQAVKKTNQGMIRLASETDSDNNENKTKITTENV